MPTIADLIGWSVLVVELLVGIFTSTMTVKEARRSFDVMATQRPARYVIRGIEILAALIFGIVITLVFSWLYFIAGGEPVAFPVRVGIFYLVVGMIPVGFGCIAWGFRIHANSVVAMRKHWLYTEGFHATAPSLHTPAESTRVDLDELILLAIAVLPEAHELDSDSWIALREKLRMLGHESGISATLPPDTTEEDPNGVGNSAG